jgi:thioredoxin reductase
VAGHKNNKMKNGKKYDVVIVGGSYAGLSAGMALGRALRKVLIIDSGDPCNKQTPHSHNFLTNDGKAPAEIAGHAKQQVSNYDTIEFLNALVAKGVKKESGFEVRVQSGESFSSRRLVFATGIKNVMPDIPGFTDCWGISVLHCPYCHGYEIRHQKTGILANGDAAFELTALISNWTRDLTVYTNGKSSLTDEQKEKLQNRKINIVETPIQKINHKIGQIEDLSFKDGTKAAMKALYARLPFVQHSPVPQSMGCEITQEGYIKIDETQKTTVDGIYACGDNASKMRTVANAVSMGTTTGLMLNKALIEEDF